MATKQSSPYLGHVGGKEEWEGFADDMRLHHDLLEVCDQLQRITHLNDSERQWRQFVTTRVYMRR